ncbi:unnamed protein product [Ectocarpus sp. CCAP 1310/34]|nr:unnamed protein product [Ectocarpus sp. CCAP 1310/34]
MLVSMTQPVYNWLGTGVLAFSSPRRTLAEGHSGTSCPTTCSSMLRASNFSPSLPAGYSRGVRKRCAIAAFITANEMTTMGHKKGGVFCLRGGSDEGDTLQVGGEEENVKRETPTATRAKAADSEDEAWPGAQKEGAPFGGVALVTERSTATGGSKDRVSYSVLADGTLEVGLAAERKEPRLPASTAPSPPPHLPTIPPTSRENTTVANASAGPRRVLQGVRRHAGALKTGVVKVMRGVTPSLHVSHNWHELLAANPTFLLARLAGNHRSRTAVGPKATKEVVRETRAAAAAAGACVARAGVAVRGGLMNTFLPAGYPGSVRPEYVRYRCWDILQAVLEGMGVGRAGSTPLAATLQWMARDGASMIGGLLFTSVASANFGVNIKTWRLFADTSNDIGLALEMLAPLPAFREGGRFLRLICIASVFKAACGVAGGATGAAITEHWAIDNNIADIGAKNGAQHKVASLLGLGLSVWFARAVSVGGSASGSRVWGWYAVLTLVHLLANYAAMRTLALRSLNPTRASLLVTEYIGQALGSTEGRSGTRGSEQDEDEGEEEKEQREEEEEGGEERKGPALDWMGRRRDQGSPTESVAVLSPFAAARRERILVLPGWVRALKPWGDFLQIHVGVPVRALVGEADDLLWLTSLYHDERSMVGVQVSYKPLGARMETTVNLVFREDASPEDRLQAMFQANVIHHLVVRDPDGIPHGEDGVDRTLFLREVTEEALRVTRKEFRAFHKALVREGWDLSRVTLGGGPWVGRWGSLAKEN